MASVLWFGGACSGNFMSFTQCRGTECHRSDRRLRPRSLASIAGPRAPAPTHRKCSGTAPAVSDPWIFVFEAPSSRAPNGTRRMDMFADRDEGLGPPTCTTPLRSSWHH